MLMNNTVAVRHCGKGGVLGRRLLIAVFLIAVAMGEGAQAQSATAAVALERVQSIEGHASLIRELSGMGGLDQTVRTIFLEIRRDASDSERAIMDREAGAVIDRIDEVHEARLKVLLTEREGWFPISVVGRRAAEAAYQIVQHSNDQAFKKDVLDRMKPLVGTGEVIDGLYAQMLDRYELGEGRRQIYGTQGTTCDEGRHAIPRDVIDPERLDARRAEVGLGPMRDYLAVMDAQYGRCTPR